MTYNSSSEREWNIGAAKLLKALGEVKGIRIIPPINRIAAITTIAVSRPLGYLSFIVVDNVTSDAANAIDIQIMAVNMYPIAVITSDVELVDAIDARDTHENIIATAAIAN